MSRQQTEMTPEKLLALGSYHYRYPYLENTSQYPGVDEEYGRAFHTEDYVRANWNDRFSVVGFEAGVGDYGQDLVILKK